MLDNASGNGYTSWRGQTVPSSGDTMLVGYTYGGDIYMEGQPDSGDIVTFLQPILTNAPSTYSLAGGEWFNGDIYYEGVPDSGDIGTMLTPNSR